MSVKEKTMSELPVIKDKVTGLWRGVVENPEQLTDLSEQEVVFAAGGGLVTRFGFNDSLIWQSMRKSARDGMIQVAGIDFNLDELARIGDFYRFLTARGNNFHCIDERLEGDEEHLEDEVHSLCGACAAVGGATNLANVEDQLLGELEQRVKQEVYSDMPHHSSMVILVDFRGADVVLGDKRDELKAADALPFNASIPLDLVVEWAREFHGDAEALIGTMVRWNVQIARNIIGGDHNQLHGLAGDTLLVVDKRGMENHHLFSVAEAAVKQVEHGEYLEIV